MIEFWQHIYEHIDPVAFSLFGFKVHWYAIMYITALIVGYLLGVKFGKTLGILMDKYIFPNRNGVRVMVGGARFSYIKNLSEDEITKKEIYLNEGVKNLFLVYPQEKKIISKDKEVEKVEIETPCGKIEFTKEDIFKAL